MQEILDTILAEQFDEVGRLPAVVFRWFSGASRCWFSGDLTFSDSGIHQSVVPCRIGQARGRGSGRRTCGSGVARSVGPP